jgi:hypothetical protein
MHVVVMGGAKGTGTFRVAEESEHELGDDSHFEA